MGAPKKAVPKDTEAKKKLRTAGKAFAEKQINKTFADSKLDDRSGTFPQFKVNEVTLGKILGKGGFGSVFEVRGFEAGKTAKAAGDDEEAAPGAMESRQFIAENCIRNGGDARYAAKMLSAEVIADPPTFIQGCMDMATETRVLSDIEHPNIIKMRACAQVSPYEETYFIVMDRLYDTLEHRMDKWAKRNKRMAGLGGALFDRKGAKKKDIMEEKLVAAFDLSAAIGHLHSRLILYRDLKPENVGFDIVSNRRMQECVWIICTFPHVRLCPIFPQRDDVKVFDFGLAKELTEKLEKDADGLYKLTAMTGSPRYMVSSTMGGLWIAYFYSVSNHFCRFLHFSTSKGPRSCQRATL
jgi:serine/threonine protein kinase